MYSVPLVRDKHLTLRHDARGFFVKAFTYNWYAAGPIRADKGQKVIVRFDVPGSKTVSVWRGDRHIGDFTRD